MLPCNPGTDGPITPSEVDDTFSVSKSGTSIPSGLAPLNISEGRIPELRAFQKFQAQIFSTVEGHSEFGCLDQKLES